MARRLGSGNQGEGNQGEGNQGEGYQGEGYQGEGYQGEGYQGEGYQGIDATIARQYVRGSKALAAACWSGGSILAQAIGFISVVMAKRSSFYWRAARKAEALIQEAVEAMLAGDVETGKTILRDYIKATDGFEKLGRAIGTPPKSLIRMFGPRGNPQARNLFGVIGYLQKRDGLTLRVTTAKRAVKRAA